MRLSVFRVEITFARRRRLIETEMNAGNGKVRKRRWSLCFCLNQDKPFIYGKIEMKQIQEYKLTSPWSVFYMHGFKLHEIKWDRETSPNKKNNNNKPFCVRENMQTSEELLNILVL